MSKCRKPVDGVEWMDGAIRQLLEGLGEDPFREGLRDTPARVRRSLLEMTSGYKQSASDILGTRFSSGDYEDLVIVRGVSFWSLCEHHLLPFHGTATVGYLPSKGRVVGLSKLARLVECYARRLQIQERMTAEIADALDKHLKPRGSGVVVRATHLCMACRGVKNPAEMVTTKFTGLLRRSATERAEFLSLDR